MVSLMDASLYTAAISAALLLGLIVTYAKVYRDTRAQVILGLTIFALFIVAFSSGRVIAPADAQGVVGSVYIMSNSASGNQVIVYSRAADGTLTWNANYATNGLGINGLTGSNQGGMVLSEDGRWLIVVNAGSNDISVFSVNHKGLTPTYRTSSQGTMPISVTVHGSVVYVLNSGGAES